MFLYNEATDKNSSFLQALDVMDKVKNKREIKYCNNTSEKMERLFEISSTLKEIEEEYNNSSKFWTITDRNPLDDEVEDGWFTWCIKESAQNVKNFKNAKEADNFWKRVKLEIESAIDDGKLETQAVFPVRISPWRKEYIKELPISMMKINKYVINYQDVAPIKQNIFFDNIKNVYKIITPILLVLSLIGYLVLTIKNKLNRDIWLFLTGIMLTGVVFELLMAYADISSFSTIKNLYLGPLYVIMNLFYSIILGICIEKIISKFFKKEINEK